MIVEETRRFKNSVGQGVGFSIDQEDVGFIASILSDKLYSDKPMAVVREYICNAIDANKEAGSTRPIRVKAPEDLDPEFSVRDFGSGLTPDEVQNLYIKFGKSTKRNSNDGIGMFGIGCKAAFAYGDCFNITSWVDGTCYTYTAQKTDSGQLVLIPIGSQASDEPNGVEITVSVRQSDIYRFREKISQFCRFSECEIEAVGFSIQPVVKRYESKNFYICSGLSGNSVFMGGVIYPLDIRQVTNFNKSLNGIVLKLNIGDVSVSADREKIEYNDDTIRVLRAALESLCREIQEECQEKVDKCETFQEAYDIVLSIRQSFGFLKLDDFTFKNRSINALQKLDLSTENLLFYERRNKKMVQRCGADYHFYPISLSKGSFVWVRNKPEKKVFANRIADNWNEGDLKYIFIGEIPKEIQEGLFLDFRGDGHIFDSVEELYPPKEEIKARAKALNRLLVYRHYSNHSVEVSRLDPNDAKYYTVNHYGTGNCVSAEETKLVVIANAFGLAWYRVPASKAKLFADCEDWIPLKELVMSRLKSYAKGFDVQAYHEGEIWGELRGLSDFSDKLTKHMLPEELDFIKKFKGTKAYSTSLVDACVGFGLIADPDFFDTSKIEGEKAKYNAILAKYKLPLKLLSGHLSYFLDKDDISDIVDYINWKNSKQEG
jgi:hypothetical protein